jgi:GAF domain-containing protein
MSLPHTSARPTETRHLFRIINTVSSTLDLDRVLRAIVDLVSDAIDCHACFIYLVAPDGSLVLRSVSDPYGALVDRLRFEPGEGLAGWVAQHNQPVYLADGALTDPRAKVVPEADEEQYQSIVAVPLRSKSGDVVGVISLHSEAPRDFTEADSDFLVHAASLVAGAIENARLYEHTRRRLAVVEGMADLARAVSSASTLDQLLPGVVRRAQRLLAAAACEVYMSRPDGTLELGAASPAAAARDHTPTATELGVVLARGRADGDARRLARMLWDDAESVALVAPLVAADELLGFLALRFPGDRPVDPETREVATSIAGQAAIAIKNLHLIEHLTEHNAIKDFLEDLSRGNVPPADLADRGRSLGCDVGRPHLVLQATPRAGAGTQSWDEVARALEVGAARAFPGSLFDRRDGAVRGLVRLGAADDAAAVARLRELHAALTAEHPLAIGLSHRCEGAASFATGFEEAQHAVTAAAVISADPSVVSYDDLGAYKYLLRVSQDGRTRDHRGDALKKLEAYDRRHRSQLLVTLEEYLKRRGNIAAAAQTLFVHPNTLRQRLRRIQDLTGLDVQNEDWLMIEIELKLLRLEHALGGPQGRPAG